METFEKELSFLSQQFNTELDAFETVEITKKATFTELNRRDPRQSSLQWSIMSLFSGKKKEEAEDEDGSVEMALDPIALSEITKTAVKRLLIVDENFSEEDKKSFLIDNIAMISFGTWLLQEKLLPFFIKSMQR